MGGEKYRLLAGAGADLQHPPGGGQYRFQHLEDRAFVAFGRLKYEALAGGFGVSGIGRGFGHGHLASTNRYPTIDCQAAASASKPMP